jgi:rod shape-determining protein MreC
MLRILQFLYRLRSFLLVVLLEVIAVWLMVSNNSPQGAAFFNSSNAVIGSALKTRSDILEFFSFPEANELLIQENALLLEKLQALTIVPDEMESDLDSALQKQYRVIGGRVISNSLRFAQNHMTLNKGSKHGIKPGMGIFNKNGIVGRIKSVSENYAVAISILNTGLLVSSKIKSTENFGSINWDGKNSQQAKMLYVPRHVKAVAGDTIVTSGYNAVFPEGILVGVISEVNPASDPNYLNIMVDLGADFSKINYVYVVENTKIVELESLYKKSEIVKEF